MRRLRHLSRHVLLLVLEVGDEVRDRVIILVTHICNVVLIWRGCGFLFRLLLLVIVESTTSATCDGSGSYSIAIRNRGIAPARPFGAFWYGIVLRSASKTT